MRTKTKDRIINALIILLFLAVMGGSAYFIFKTMTHWRIKGLGFAIPTGFGEQGAPMARLCSFYS